jgi:hypothetical protein
MGYLDRKAEWEAEAAAKEPDTRYGLDIPANLSKAQRPDLKKHKIVSLTATICLSLLLCEVSWHFIDDGLQRLPVLIAITGAYYYILKAIMKLAVKILPVKTVDGNKYSGKLFE